LLCAQVRIIIRSFGMIAINMLYQIMVSIACCWWNCNIDLLKFECNGGKDCYSFTGSVLRS
jgi:hypothetical protein